MQSAIEEVKRAFFAHVNANEEEKTGQKLILICWLVDELR